MDFRTVLLCLSIVFALGGSAKLALSQPDVESGEPTSSEIQAVLTASGLPADSDAGFGKYLRPLDDSDREMRQLVETFFEVTPCGNRERESDLRDGICPEALGLLAGGGNRLAGYLIRQFEENEREGFPNRGTYLRLVAYTESDVATRYLLRLVDQREAAYRANGGNPLDLVEAIGALGRTRQPETTERLVSFATGSDKQLQSTALSALRTLTTKQPLPATATQRLAAARSEVPASDESLQRRFDEVMGAKP
jgi:hypothetical protein